MLCSLLLIINHGIQVDMCKTITLKEIGRIFLFHLLINETSFGHSDKSQLPNCIFTSVSLYHHSVVAFFDYFLCTSTSERRNKNITQIIEYLTRRIFKIQATVCVDLLEVS